MIQYLWRDGVETKLLPGRENVLYNYKGAVSCVC